MKTEDVIIVPSAEQPNGLNFQFRINAPGFPGGIFRINYDREQRKNSSYVKRRVLETYFEGMCPDSNYHTSTTSALIDTALFVTRNAQWILDYVAKDIVI